MIENDSDYGEEYDDELSQSEAQTPAVIKS